MSNSKTSGSQIFAHIHKPPQCRLSVINEPNSPRATEHIIQLLSQDEVVRSLSDNLTLTCKISGLAFVTHKTPEYQLTHVDKHCICWSFLSLENSLVPAGGGYIIRKSEKYNFIFTFQRKLF